MGFMRQWKNLPRDKTKEEVEAHTGGEKLEKEDFKAIVLAAFLTFGPVLLGIVLVVFGLLFVMFAL